MSKGKEFKKIKPKDSTLFKIKGMDTVVSYDKSKPVFSLHNMKYGGDNCISNCSEESRSAIIHRLLRICQYTWEELKSKSKHGLGFEPIPQGRFKVPFPQMVTEDVPILVSRYSDAGRMAGFRINDIYHIVLVGEDLYSH